MARSSIAAWGLLLVAIAAWGSFYFLVLMIDTERIAYLDASIIASQESVRGENASRLHATVQSTEVERAALESLVSMTILRVVETLEEAGREAGASGVTIGGVTQVSNAPKGLSAYSLSLTAQGSFPALMRTISLFEMLPIPATLDQFELGKSEKGWNLNARMQVIVAAP